MKYLLIATLSLSFSMAALADDSVSAMRYARCLEKKASRAHIFFDFYLGADKDEGKAILSMGSDNGAMLTSVKFEKTDNQIIVNIPSAIAGSTPSTLYIPSKDGDGKYVEGSDTMLLSCVVGR